MPDGTAAPNPVVSCRVCGHEEPEATLLSVGLAFPDKENDEKHSARLALARADQRRRQRLSTVATLRQTRFPTYGADGWPARLGGSGSRSGQVTEITIDHYDAPVPDPAAGDRPRLAITTKSERLHPEPALGDARKTLQSWIRRDQAAGGWPEASRAAVTLWLRAREREGRAAVLDAVRSAQPVIIDGTPTETLMLTTPRKQWVAVARPNALTVVVAARGVEPESLRLEPIADPPARLLEPEPA